MNLFLKKFDSNFFFVVQFEIQFFVFVSVFLFGIEKKKKKKKFVTVFFVSAIHLLQLGQELDVGRPHSRESETEAGWSLQFIS